MSILKKCTSYTIILLLAGCATAADDIRKLGPKDSVIISKPYQETSQCVSEEILAKHDAGMSIQPINKGNSTIVNSAQDGGGYFVQIDKLSNGSAKVSTYFSQNMIFSEMLSSEIMGIVKKYCQ